jgi:hypothetical protein
MATEFDPVSSRDYVPELVTGYKQINEGMDNFWSQEIDNVNYAASFAGKDMIAMADMSSTIGEKLKVREDRKKQEDFAKGYMWLYENGVSDEAMLAYNQATEDLYEEGRVINDMRVDWESKGGDIWNSVEFKNLNKAEKHGAVVAFVEGKLQQYDPANNEKMQNATSYPEYKAAEALARLQIYRQLGDINPALVNKHFFEGQRKKEQTAYNNWNAERTKAIKEEEIATAKDTLRSCAMTGADGVNCIMNFSNNYAGLYGGQKGKARREALAHLKTLADGGVLRENQTDKMLDMKFKHADGHWTSFREQYPLEANELEDAVDDYAASELTRKNNENKVNAHNDTQEFLKGIPADKISEKGYDLEIIKQAEELITKQEIKYNGHADPYLTKMVESLRRDKNIIKSRKLDAEQEFLDGTLNSETLKKYPIMVQLDPEIIKKAKAGDVAIGDAKGYEGDLEAMVKKAAKLTADGYDDGANQLTRYFQATWRQRAIQIHATLPDDQKHKAGQMAFDEIKGTFEMESKKGASLSMFQDEFGNFRSPNAMNAKEAKENAHAIDQARLLEREMIGKYGVEGLSRPRLFFSEQELINIQNDSAAKGVLAIPEKAKRIAKQFDGINAIDVINLQREALDMEPLTSNALEEFNGLPKSSKELLNYSSTSITAARAWGTYGKEVISIRPDGEELLKLSKENGLDFAPLAAGVELGEMLEREGITFNSTDELYKVLNADQKADYNRFLYKYSGGTDKYALDNLIHPDILKTLETTKEEEVVQEVDEKEIYTNKIKHLDPKNRNVPIK